MVLQTMALQINLTNMVLQTMTLQINLTNMVLQTMAFQGKLLSHYIFQYGWVTFQYVN